MTEESKHPDNSDGGMERRGFLVRAVGILSLPMATLLGWPLVVSLVGTIYTKSKTGFSKALGFDRAPLGQPVELTFPYVKTDAYLRTDEIEDAWLIKHSPAKATVFSPICPHMGCRYEWHARLQKFICPCHGSVFSITGKVLAGPAPRGLDTLPCKIEDATLYIKWERFEPGVPEKIVV